MMVKLILLVLFTLPTGDNPSGDSPGVSKPVEELPEADGRLNINRDPKVYAIVYKEAKTLAARGQQYYRHPDGGHPAGVAPGCRMAGTGYSWDSNRPNHCYYGELPDSRIVARVRVRGKDGAWYWSAHYR